MPEKTPDPPPPETGSAAASHTSLSLLDRLRDNDPEAWRRLVALYGPLVLYWGRRAGLNEDDAADLLQDVFRSVTGAIGRFRRDRPGDTFRGWLWSIARNKLRDHFRDLQRGPVAAGGSEAQARLTEVPDEEPESAAESEPSRALLRRALELVRGGFEDPTWQAFWRTTVDGRPPADVATELGLGLASVYQAKSRVLRRLREELGGLLD
jgi:RNA polymerase sigma-70 factor (ECF subfamily)